MKLWKGARDDKQGKPFMKKSNGNRGDEKDEKSESREDAKQGASWTKTYCKIWEELGGRLNDQSDLPSVQVMKNAGHIFKDSNENK